MNYKKLLILAAVALLALIVVVNVGNALEDAESEYNEALVIEKRAIHARCTIEKELASLKLSMHFADDLELTDEDVKRLLDKNDWDCDKKDDPFPNGNFTHSTGGLDEFLLVNGAEFVKEAGDTFKKVGELYNVKPEVMVCIAQADSSLGKALKSTNNIANVGNNDRGDVVHYATLEAGIEAIGRVLNNQYLSYTQTIGDLSRGGGNETGKIYASSSFNWNKNVKYCLRNILQDPTIDESFKFRTNQ